MTNLNPNVGTELADGISYILNGALQEELANFVGAMRNLGEGTAVYDAMKDIMMRIQNKYNDEVVPAMKKCNESFLQFTNMAEYVNKLQAGNSVKDVEIKAVGDNNYDACLGL